MLNVKLLLQPQLVPHTEHISFFGISAYLKANTVSLRYED